MNASSRWGFAWATAGIIFLSAFLLFQVQPVISKAILPWFGGSPAVWTTCMLFFQLLLLAGYAYAHWLSSISDATRQTLLHSGLLLLALVLLPILPRDGWKPPDSSYPTWRILTLLLVHVGLPYFLLAANGPLAQAWFAIRYPGTSPYRLYSLSNVGSLGALLSYPLLVEPHLTTQVQGLAWSGGFVLFALGCVAVSVASRRFRLAGTGQRHDTQSPKTAAPSTGTGTGTGTASPATRGGRADAAPQAAAPPPPGLATRLLWMLLPALASMMLLAVTNHLCQDVAVIPFLWVAPLSLYLLTFIICFDGERWYHRLVFGPLCAAAVGAIAVLTLESSLDRWLHRIARWLERWPAASRLAKTWAGYDLSDYLEDITSQVVIFLVALFAICMVCHGELVKLKPAPRYLTSFYLRISAGGAVGGLFVSLICPQIFTGYYELQLGLATSFLLAMLVIGGWCWGVSRDWRRMTRIPLLTVWLLTLAVTLPVVVLAQLDALETKALSASRNFYGVLRVEEDANGDDDEAGDDLWRTRSLYHGRILHGVQFRAEDLRRQPTTYYSADSGVGVAVEALRGRRGGPLRFAVIGLGTGTMAAYGERGDSVKFYEINPQVIRLADQYFTYLADCPERPQIALGDARVSMERELAAGHPQQLDLLAIDAFSGDAIPTHLLTVEAFSLYRQHLREGGVIAVHISNRYLDLFPIVVGIAEQHEMHWALVESDDAGGVADASSDWVLVSNDETFFELPELLEAIGEPAATPQLRVPPWTDQYSNLIKILR